MRKPTLALAGMLLFGAALIVQGCRKDSPGPLDTATGSLDQTEQWTAPGTPIAGQYIVVLKGSLGKIDAEQAVLSVAAAYGVQPDFVYTTALSGFAGKVPAERLDALRQDPRVNYIEQDQWIGLPPYRVEPSPVMKTDAQTTPWGIQRVNGATSYSGSGVAWIIDTGIDFTHPDLTVDKARSKNFVRTNRSANDDNGHGTHVSGIIAAINNTIGVIGVAPGATLVAVKVLNSAGSGTISQVIAGVNYVASNGQSGDVANMSLGGSVSSSLDQAVLGASANVKFCIAAGNSSANAANYSPARVNGPNVYTISAFGQGDVFASFSNWGNPPIDYSEPGVSIYSTYKGGTYATLSGTSMATPHAAGILLLGSISSGGNVSGDPDGNPDVIGVH